QLPARRDRRSESPQSARRRADQLVRFQETQKLVGERLRCLERRTVPAAGDLDELGAGERCGEGASGLRRYRDVFAAVDDERRNAASRTVCAVIGAVRNRASESRISGELVACDLTLPALAPRRIFRK